MYDLRDGYVPPHLRGDGGQGNQPAATVPPAPAPPLSPEPVGAKPGWVVPRARGGVKKYPYDTLEVNGTFQVPPDVNQPKWYSFQIYCYKMGNKHGKRFRCHRYPDGTFEVWRES